MIDVVSTCSCDGVDRILKVVKTMECLLITEEGKYHTNTACDNISAVCAQAKTLLSVYRLWLYILNDKMLSHKDIFVDFDLSKVISGMESLIQTVYLKMRGHQNPQHLVLGS